MYELTIVKDMMRQALRIPEPIQTQVGEAISKVYRREYDRFAAEHPNAPAYEEFWNIDRGPKASLFRKKYEAQFGGKNNAPEYEDWWQNKYGSWRAEVQRVRSAVQGSTLDFSRLKPKGYPKTWMIDKEAGQAEGNVLDTEKITRQIFRGIHSLRTPEGADRPGPQTVAALENVLLRSIFPGIGESAQKAVRNLSNPSAAVAQIFTDFAIGAKQNMPLYNRFAGQKEQQWSNFMLIQGFAEGRAGQRESMPSGLGFLEDDDGEPVVPHAAGFDAENPPFVYDQRGGILFNRLFSSSGRMFNEQGNLEFLSQSPQFRLGPLQPVTVAEVDIPRLFGAVNQARRLESTLNEISAAIPRSPTLTMATKSGPAQISNIALPALHGMHSDPYTQSALALLEVMESANGDLERSKGLMEGIGFGQSELDKHNQMQAVLHNLPGLVPAPFWTQAQGGQQWATLPSNLSDLSFTGGRQYHKQVALTGNELLVLTDNAGEELLKNNPALRELHERQEIARSLFKTDRDNPEVTAFRVLRKFAKETVKNLASPGRLGIEPGDPGTAIEQWTLLEEGIRGEKKGVDMDYNPMLREGPDVISHDEFVANRPLSGPQIIHQQLRGKFALLQNIQSYLGVQDFIPTSREIEMIPGETPHSRTVARLGDRFPGQLALDAIQKFRIENDMPRSQFSNRQVWMAMQEQMRSPTMGPVHQMGLTRNSILVGSQGQQYLLGAEELPEQTSHGRYEPIKDKEVVLKGNMGVRARIYKYLHGGDPPIEALQGNPPAADMDEIWKRHPHMSYEKMIEHLTRPIKTDIITGYKYVELEQDEYGDPTGEDMLELHRERAALSKTLTVSEMDPAYKQMVVIANLMTNDRGWRDKLSPVSLAISNMSYWIGMKTLEGAGMRKRGIKPRRPAQPPMPEDLVVEAPIESPPVAMPPGGGEPPEDPPIAEGSPYADEPEPDRSPKPKRVSSTRPKAKQQDGQWIVMNKAGKGGVELDRGTFEEMQAYAQANPGAVIQRVPAKAQLPPELIEKAQALEAEFPEYIDKHLGRGEDNIPAYREWLGGLSGEQRARFDELHDPLVKQQLQLSGTGLSTLRWLADRHGGWKFKGKKAKQQTSGEGLRVAQQQARGPVSDVESMVPEDPPDWQNIEPRQEDLNRPAEAIPAQGGGSRSQSTGTAGAAVRIHPEAVAANALAYANLAERQSQPSTATLADFARNMNWSSAAAITKIQFGEAQVERGAPEHEGATGPITGVSFPRGGVSKEMVGEGMELAQRAWMNALSSPLPSDPRDAVATLAARLNKFVGDYVKNFTDDVMKSRGITSEDSPGSVATKIRTIAKDLLGQPTRAVARILGTSYDEEGNMASQEGAAKWEDIAYNNNRLFNQKSLEAEMQRNPLLREYIENNFGNAQAAAAGPLNVVNLGGNAYQFGGGSVGGGFGGGGARQTSGIWRGKLGGALYGAYIAKRLWSWTGGPVLQEATQYGADTFKYSPMEAMESARMGEDWNLLASDTGFAIRQERIQKTMTRGAYQQFGGVYDAAFSFTGQPGAEGFARGFQGLKMGAGLAAAGYMAPMIAASFLPAAAGAAAAAGPIAIAAGAFIAGGTGIMEARNAIFPQEEPWSWGGIFRSYASGWHRTTGMYKAMGYSPTSATVGAFMSPILSDSWYNLYAGAHGITEEDMLAQLTPEQRAIVDYQGEPEALSNVQSMAKALQYATGEPIESLTPALRSLHRALGSVPENMPDIARQAVEQGLSTPEFVQAAMTGAGQLGISPGTAEFRQFWDNWSGNLPVAERETMMTQWSQVARYGGMLSGYFEDPRRAAQYASRWNIQTQGRGQAIQALMAAANNFGFDAESVLGYELAWEDHRYTEKPYTLGDAVGRLEHHLGPYRSMLSAQLANQLMPLGVPVGTALGAVEQYGIRTEVQLGAANQYLSTAQQFFSPDQVADYSGALLEASQGQNAYQANLISSSIAPNLFKADYPLEAISAMSGLGLSNNIMTRWGQAIGGDIKALSYDAWKLTHGSLAAGSPAGFAGARMFDLGGVPLYQSNTSWSHLRSALEGQARGGNIAATNYFGANTGSGMSDIDWMVNQFGFAPDVAKAGVEGYRGLQGAPAANLRHSDKMFGFQMAGIGVAMQQLNLQRNFLWGADQGGAWKNPAWGSMWNLEDRMRELQHQSTMYGFAYSQERLDTQNAFAIQQENINLQRMDASHANQRWQSGFNYQGMQIQQAWTREDWQYQDQMRGLSFGWQMEDMDEAIRFSSGRQRKQLLKQKDRAALTHSLQEEQVDTQRTRQEETWAREEERFLKQTEYAETLIQLDVEGFELNKKQRETYYRMDQDHLKRQMDDYQKSKALQDEIQEKQREHQAKQLELQQAALGVQAAAAAAQKEHNDAMLLYTQQNEDVVNQYKEMAHYDPAEYLAQFTRTAQMLSAADSVALGNIRATIHTMNGFNSNAASAVATFVSRINNLDLNKLRTINDILRNIE